MGAKTKVREIRIQFPDDEISCLEKTLVKAKVRQLTLDAHLLLLKEKIRRNKEELQHLLQSHAEVLLQKEAQDNLMNRLKAEQMLLKGEAKTD